MKKYLMGFIAIIFATVIFAFTNSSTSNSFVGCTNDNLAWFIVPGSTCYTETELDDAFNAVVTGTGTNISVFIGDQADFLNNPSSGACLEDGECICAFAIDKMKLAENGSDYSIPASGVDETDIECIVLKEQ